MLRAKRAIQRRSALRTRAMLGDQSGLTLESRRALGVVWLLLCNSVPALGAGAVHGSGRRDRDGGLGRGVVGDESVPAHSSQASLSARVPMNANIFRPCQLQRRVVLESLALS